MKKDINEMKSEMKGETSNNLEGLIKRTDSPFTSSVLECTLPRNFYLP